MTDTTPEFKSASLEVWAKAAAKSAPGGNVDALSWITPDGIAVKPLYTAADTAELKVAFKKIATSISKLRISK